MLIECGADLFISHSRRLLLVLLIVHLALQTQDWKTSFVGAYKKLFRLLLRVVISRIVFRAEVFQSKRPHRGYLRYVLAGFRPVEMVRVPGENDHGAGRISFQLT